VLGHRDKRLRKPDNRCRRQSATGQLQEEQANGRSVGQHVGAARIVNDHSIGANGNGGGIFPAKRQAWIKALDELAARKPKIVVPAHQTQDAPQGLDAVKFTRDYLVAFHEEEEKAKDSATLIAAMTKRYPNLADIGSLELGAKVAKGEMKWG